MQRNITRSSPKGRNIQTLISGAYLRCGRYWTGKNTLGIRFCINLWGQTSSSTRESRPKKENSIYSPNTHEPIISQELWDSVQKRRKRVERATPWGSHSHRLSGYLFCADCGIRMTLQIHYSRKDDSFQYSYLCGGYASRVNACSAHGISVDSVEALLLSSVQRLSRFVLQDEKAFALELQAM